MLRKSYPEELFAVSKYLRIIYKMGYNSIKEIQNYTFTGIPRGRMRNHPRIPDVLNSQIYRKPWEGNCRGMAPLGLAREAWWATVHGVTKELDATLFSH